MKIFSLSLVFFIVVALSGADRLLSPPELNPQCPTGMSCDNYTSPITHQTSANNLVYVKSEGADDALHYFISSINGLSVLVFQTNISTDVDINWTVFLNGTSPSPSIAANGVVYNSVGFSVTKLYVYDDADGSADFSNSAISYTIPFVADDILWDLANIDNDSFSVSLQTSNVSADFLNTDGYVKVSFQIFGSDGRFNLLPQLLHTDLSSQLEIELVSLYNNLGNESQTRYGLEVVVATPTSFTTENISKSRSMDDEYTPGTFITCQVATSNTNGFENYLMWKPVGYSGSKRSLQNAINLQDTLLQKVENIGGLNDAFFGTNNYLANSFNISFGIDGDKLFYSDYLVWTLEIGIGVAPVESFSSLVIALLVVCVAVPGAGLLGGGSYGVYSKFYKKPKATPAKTVDEIKEPVVNRQDEDNVRF